MADLVPRPTSGVQPTEWRTRSAVRATNRHVDINAVRMRGEVELQQMRTAGIAHVAQDAMQHVTFLSEMEARLATVSPISTSRLQAIGDIAALSLAQVVSDTVGKLR